MSRPTVSFKTLGCRLNQAETAAMTARFESAGYDVVSYGGPSDVVVVHGCTVTSAADNKTIQYARSARQSSPAVVVIAGCPAEVDADAVKKSSSADLVIGQAGKFDLPQILASHGLAPPPVMPSGSEPPAPAFSTTRGYLRIQDGCDCNCAYCIVPRTRGRAKGRDPESILTEAQQLAEAGHREIVVTGANLGYYEHNGKHLAEILESLHSVPRIDRIRLSSIEPFTSEGPVIELMKQTSSKICRSLHIPLQTGYDDLLKAMGRRYNVSNYRALIEKTIASLGNIGLGTDIIVGLPGETDEAFSATCTLIETLPFTRLHVFRYSKRPDTRAATMDGQVPEAIKKERMEILGSIAVEKRSAFGASFTGKPVSVLVERVDSDGTVHGWTSEYVQLRATSDRTCPRNSIIEVVPSGFDDDTLIGTVRS